MSSTENLPQTTIRDLVDGLRRLGVKAGDKVMVHSSLKSLGRMECGPQGVVLALQEVLTADGTLMMPSFNHGKPWEAGGAGFYDPAGTPTTNGAIPDAFWRVPDVHRSLDPTHPIACWGKDARRYTQWHHRALTMGPDSPLGLLGREGGKAVMMGVGYGPNTYHHVVEMTLATPCLGQRTEAYPVHLPDGRTVMGRTWGWRQDACPICDGVRYAKNLAPLTKRATVGDCELLSFDFRDAMRVISQALADGVDGFPPCSRCPIRPRKVEFTVESDWDAAKGCLEPGSAAWTY